MEYRGHILIVFGLSLMASPWAIKQVEARLAGEAENAAPAVVVTEAQASAECDRSSIQTALGRIGCMEKDNAAPVRRIDRTMTSANDARRMQSSGAMFVSARD